MKEYVHKYLRSLKRTNVIFKHVRNTVICSNFVDEYQAEQAKYLSQSRQKAAVNSSVLSVFLPCCSDETSVLLPVPKEFSLEAVLYLEVGKITLSSQAKRFYRGEAWFSGDASQAWQATGHSKAHLGTRACMCAGHS